MINSQKLIVILGPTASGKTGIAQRLCKEFSGYIISADSRQVYRYMDIGTGKVEDREELALLEKQREAMKNKSITETTIFFNSIPHYMIDILNPQDEYNVALYKRDVYGILNQELGMRSSTLRDGPSGSDSNENEEVPFLVGGTGLYIDAVVDNWQFPQGEPNVELRNELEEKIKSEGLELSWSRLIKLDPDCEKFLQKNNPRRVVRALEYVLTTGKKFSENRGKGIRQFDVLKIGITLSREQLYEKIDRRVDRRIEEGMIDEVRDLHEKQGLSWERLRHFGLEYRVITDYLAGELSSVDDMAQRLKWDIHSYARRQLTWFRKDKEIQWVQGYDDAKDSVKGFIK